jgi:hypothetical protein
MLRLPYLPARVNPAYGAAHFPIGDHDDGPDALEMAFRLLRDLRGGATAGVSQLPLQTC